MKNWVNKYKPVNQNDVLNPGKMIAFGDGILGDNDLYDDGHSIISRTKIYTKFKNDIATQKRVNTRHNENANFLIVDGHVDVYSLEYSYSSKTASIVWRRIEASWRGPDESVIPSI